MLSTVLQNLLLNYRNSPDTRHCTSLRASNQGVSPKIRRSKLGGGCACNVGHQTMMNYTFKKIFERHLFATNLGLSFVLSGLGDLIEQRLERKKKPDKKASNQLEQNTSHVHLL